MSKRTNSLIVLSIVLLLSMSQARALAASQHTTPIDEYQGNLASGSIVGLELHRGLNSAWIVILRAGGPLHGIITNLVGKNTLLSNNETYINPDDKFLEFTAQNITWTVSDINESSIWLVLQNQGALAIQYYVISFGGDAIALLEDTTALGWMAAAIITWVVIAIVIVLKIYFSRKPSY